MRYVSRKKELCLILRPTDRIIDEQRRVHIIPGKKVEFFAGRYETSDPEMIEFLHTHPYNGNKFYEITEADEKLVEDTQKSKAIPVTTGAVSTGNVTDTTTKEIVTATPLVERVRPFDITAVSPELVIVIDERINAALGTIIDLLKKDEKKEIAIKEGKSQKKFSCPYCGISQPSGFAVGKHKAECEKRPQ